MKIIREGKVKLGGIKPYKNSPRPDVKPQGRRAVPGLLYIPVPGACCPNCSLPRPALDWNGKVFICGGCGGYWSASFVKAYPSLFSLNPDDPGPPEAA